MGGSGAPAPKMVRWGGLGAPPPKTVAQLGPHPGFSRLNLSFWRRGTQPSNRAVASVPGSSSPVPRFEVAYLEAGRGIRGVGLWVPLPKAQVQAPELWERAQPRDGFRERDPQPHHANPRRTRSAGWSGG